jgi:transposase
MWHSQENLEPAAVMRFETEPGRKRKWTGKNSADIRDGHETKLYAFVMVLGYSQMPFVRFTTDMRQSTLLACHALAFEYFGGVPKEILYDNMRTAFEPDGEGVWHPTRRLAACAVHYGFVPHHCRVRRPETKGKVERLIGYLDHHFWARVHACAPYSLTALNEKVLDWINHISTKPLEELADRETRFRREKTMLTALPHAPLIGGMQSARRQQRVDDSL